MACKSCAERRKRLAAAKAKKREQGKQVQAAALGAVLAVSEAVGKVIEGEKPDNHGEVEDE